LQAALRSFAAGRDLTAEELGAFSNLAPDAERALSSMWSALTTEQRSTLCMVLGEAERQDLRLDFNAVYAVALRDPDPDVRASAAGAIVEDPSARLLDPLLAAASADASAEVRAAAAGALAPYALRAEVGDLAPPAAERIQAVLLAALNDQQAAPPIRSNALASLGYLSDAGAQQALEQGYREQPLRVGALRGMGRSADPRWLRPLLESLGSRDAAEREEAARAAGEIEDERAVSSLADAVDDPVTDVRLAAIEALGRIGGEDAREALLYAAQDPNAIVRDAAERALTGLESAEDLLGG